VFVLFVYVGVRVSVSVAVIVMLVLALLLVLVVGVGVGVGVGACVLLNYKIIKVPSANMHMTSPKQCSSPIQRCQRLLTLCVQRA
jgi:hypothetical protein